MLMNVFSIVSVGSFAALSHHGPTQRIRIDRGSELPSTGEFESRSAILSGTSVGQRSRSGPDPEIGSGSGQDDPIGHRSHAGR